MYFRVNQFFPDVYHKGFLAVILILSSVPSSVQLSSYESSDDGSHECFRREEIFQYEPCPRQACVEGGIARNQCCMIKTSGGFYNPQPVDLCRCERSFNCYQKKIDSPRPLPPFVQQLPRVQQQPVAQQLLGVQQQPVAQQLSGVQQQPVAQQLLGLQPQPVAQQLTGVQPQPVALQLPDVQPSQIEQQLPGNQPPQPVDKALPRAQKLPEAQQPLIAEPPKSDETLPTDPRYCSYSFEINFYKMCPMAFCKVSSETLCCKQRQFFSVPELCLCHPQKSCDISDLPPPKADCEDEPHLPGCKSQRPQPNHDNDTSAKDAEATNCNSPDSTTNTSRKKTAQGPVQKSGKGVDKKYKKKPRKRPGKQSEKGSRRKSNKKLNNRDNIKSDEKNKKTSDKHRKKHGTGKKSDKNSKEDTAKKDNHDDKPSLCTDRLRLLNAEKVEDECQYKGIAKLTRVDQNGKALVCNAVYTIAQVKGHVRRTFLTPQACGILLQEDPKGLSLILQIGDQNYPIPSPRIFTPTKGPNGNWFITPSPLFINLFRDLGACQSNACPYDPKAMRGKVDFNDCKAVSYGASDAKTFATDGLREKRVAFYPGGCSDQSDFFGAENTICFRTLDDKNAYCANDAGAPVYCRSPSTNEWILLGMVAFQRDCDARPGMKVIPFPL